MSPRGKWLAALLALSAVSLATARRPQMHGHTRGGRVEGEQKSQGEQKFAGTQLDPNSLCLKHSVLSIEYPPISKGWMTMNDWGAEFRVLDKAQYPFIRIGVDGFPCAEKGCCQHSLTIRTTGSDWKVVQGVINDYAEFLVKVLPWTPHNAILEGGGNIGVATSLFAFMYPNTPIVVLEPEPENCMLLKNNTARFPNVHVKCMGLWGKANAAVTLMPGGDGEQWGWKLKEVPAGTEGALQTTSVPALMDEFKIKAFDFAKIDIEGAEFNVFGKDADQSWVAHTQLLALELHGNYGEVSSLTESLRERGFSSSPHSEYEVFARHALHERISSA